LKCTRENTSMKIRVDTKVMNDLNEFILQKFQEAQLSDSEDDPCTFGGGRVG